MASLSLPQWPTRNPAAGGVPRDVRLINGVAFAVGALLLGLLLAAAVWWLVRAPWWTLRSIELQGDLQRNSPATLRANILPRLNGNFFNLDLQQARQVVQTVPWIRRAVVRRVWPNGLSVHLQEHRPAARWASSDGNERLVNTYGEVFEANLGEVEGEALPVFAGPDGSSAQVLQMHQQLSAVFSRLDRRVVKLDLSGRGSWSLELDDDAEIVLGRGTPEEVLARTERFAATLTQVVSAYRPPLIGADLRHTSGYAVRLKGVTSIDATAPKGRK